MPLSSRIYFAGIAKQTAKGSPATDPTFGHGVRSGSVLSVDLDQVVDDLTSTERFDTAVRRAGVVNGANYVTRVYPQSIGLYLLGVLGAIDTVGTAAPFTHTITPASTLPYFTVFGQADTEEGKIEDAKVDEIIIAWDGVAPPELTVAFMGAGLNFGTAWTAATDESTDEFLPTANTGASFQLDVDSATPVDANVVGGSIAIRNNLSPIVLSKQIDPDDVWEARQSAEVTLDVIPDDLDEWRTVVTGSAAGTGVQSTPVYGSFNVKFQEDADNNLQIQGTRTPFLIAFPEGDPEGAPIRLSYAAPVLKPAGADALTVTLLNDVSSY